MFETRRIKRGTMAKKQAVADREPASEERNAISEWRRNRFYEVAPVLTKEQVDSLTMSTASAHDLEKLLSKGCALETALRILI